MKWLPVVGTVTPQEPPLIVCSFCATISQRGWPLPLLTHTGSVHVCGGVDAAPAAATKRSCVSAMLAVPAEHLFWNVSTGAPAWSTSSS